MASKNISIDGSTINSPVTVAEEIQGSFNTENDSSKRDELKDLIEQLLTQVNSVDVPEKRAQVVEIVEEAKNLKEEIDRDDPRRKYVEVSSQGIREAAEKLGEVGVPVLKTTMDLLPLVAQLFPK